MQGTGIPRTQARSAWLKGWLLIAHGQRPRDLTQLGLLCWASAVAMGTDLDTTWVGVG